MNNNGNIEVKGGKGSIKGYCEFGFELCSNGGNGSDGRIRIDYNELINMGYIIPLIGYSNGINYDKTPPNPKKLPHWHCSRCSTKNNGETIKCKMCGSLKK